MERTSRGSRTGARPARTGASLRRHTTRRGTRGTHTDEVLFDLTKYGAAAFVGPDYNGAMPAFEGILSDDGIVAVHSYVKSRWPERIRRRHDEMNAVERD